MQPNKPKFKEQKNLHNDLNILQFFRTDVNQQWLRIVWDQKLDALVQFVHVEFAVVLLPKGE